MIYDILWGGMTIEGESLSGVKAIKVGKNTFKIDLINGNALSFHCLINGKSIRVEFLGLSSSHYKFKINGSTHQVAVLNPMEKVLLSNEKTTKSRSFESDFRAPMPGLVLRVLVNPGDCIESGESLLALESMKMENILRSQGNGMVDAVLVGPGETVEKGQVLMKFKKLDQD
jgi:biotin carboxyl carrier protein